MRQLILWALAVVAGLVLIRPSRRAIAFFVLLVAVVGLFAGLSYLLFAS